MIPKIIHQTWHSETFPVIFKKIKETNKNVNSDFEFKLWHQEEGKPDNVEDLLKKEYSELWTIYEKCKFGVQKADIIRLMLIYHYGGAYIDMDMLCLRSLNSLIDFDGNFMYIAMEPKEQTQKLYNNENVVCNAFIVAPPRHPILKQALEEIKQIHKSHGDTIFGVFNVFGGDLLAKAILSQDSKNCKYVNRKMIYPINDPKFNDLPSSADDAKMLKSGQYSDGYIVHYWIHSNFESSELLDKFEYNEEQSIHHNVWMFFKTLYRHNRHLQ
jgi:hypothetical protein